MVTLYFLRSGSSSYATLSVCCSCSQQQHSDPSSNGSRHSPCLSNPLFELEFRNISGLVSLSSCREASWGLSLISFPAAVCSAASPQEQGAASFNSANISASSLAAAMEPPATGPSRAVVTPQEQKVIDSHLQRVLRLPGNDCCADCGAKHPRWASVNIGGSRVMHAG